MVREKLHIFITLIAALTVTIISAVVRFSLFDFALRLVVTIAVFFVLGSIIKTYMDSQIKVEIEDLEEELALDGENLTNDTDEVGEVDGNAAEGEPAGTPEPAMAAAAASDEE